MSAPNFVRHALSRQRALSLALNLALCLLMSACALPQQAHVEPAQVPARFKELASDAAQAQVPNAWWQLFDDPTLNDL